MTDDSGAPVNAATQNTPNPTTDQAAPAVAGQTRAYTAKALRDYRADARPSVGVAAMNEAAKGLTDADIAAIAVFLERPE